MDLIEQSKASGSCELNIRRSTGLAVIHSQETDQMQQKDKRNQGEITKVYRIILRDGF